MKPYTERNTASLAVIGIDIGKDVFHLVALGIDGKTAFRRRDPARQPSADSGHSGGRDRTAGSTRTKPSGSQKRVRLTSPEGQPSAGR